MNRIIDDVCKIIDNIDFISFDIFDTLIHRQVSHPHAIFYLMSAHKMFNKKFSSIQTFDTFRVAAETEAREEFSKISCSSEISIEDIYFQLQKKCFFTSKKIKILMALEDSIEKKFLYASPIMKEIFLYAQMKQKKILLISDMYLHPRFIEKVLYVNGYLKPYNLYVSGYTGMNKSSGEIYKYLINVKSINPNKWLHIGDNYFSDIEIPQKFSIKSFYYNDFFYKKNPYYTYYNNDIGHCLSFGIIQKMLFDNKSFFKKEPIIKLGAIIFGPLIFGFSLWLSTILKQRNYTKALFVARDMHIVLDMMCKFKNFFDFHIDASYVWLPRFLFISALFDAFDQRCLDAFFNSENELTISDISKLLNIEPEKFYGIDGKDKKQINERLKIIMPDIYSNNSEKLELFVEYIAEIFGTHDRLCFIDVGYTGTLQHMFDTFIKVLKPNIVLDSLLLGKTPYPPNNFSANVDSWLSPIAKEIMGGGAEILECALIGNQNKLLYLSKNNGKITLNFNKNTDSYLKIFADSIQMGIELFFCHATALLKNYNIEKLVSVGWSDSFMRLVVNPTEDEVNIIGNLEHDCYIFENTKKKLIYKIDSKLPSDLKTGYNKSFWKNGFLVKNKVSYKDIK